MSKAILSAFADEYSSDLSEQIYALSNHGIKYVEVRGVNGKNISTLEKSEVDELARTLSREGIGVSAIGSPIGKVDIYSDLDKHFLVADRVLESAAKLNAPFVRMFSFYSGECGFSERERELVIKSVDRLIGMAEPYGIKLCHENEADIYGDSPDRCLDLLDALGGKLRAVFDMGNFVLGGHSPSPAYEKLLPYIEYFHIKDALFSGAIVPAGLGDAEIKKIIDLHRAYSKKDFFISLEPHLETFSGLDTLVTEKKFTNPYKYADQKSAFDDAVKKLGGIL